MPDPNPTARVVNFVCPVCATATPTTPAVQGRGQIGNDAAVAAWGSLAVCPTCSVIVWVKDP